MSQDPIDYSRFKARPGGPQGPKRPPGPRRPRGPQILILIIAALAVLAYLGSTTISYYVDSLWFGALGYAAVFWTRLDIQVAIFCAFAVATFIVLYGAFWVLRPANLDQLLGATILVNQQRVTLPIGPLVTLGALIVAIAIAAEV
ncbi:MAG: UPF0182 family protein, partial [Steroidobacteraceae bacterium]